MIDLRLLQQFVAVAEELHFRRAAERLHMAQPPLSQAIRKLETELGSALFVRTRRQVTLTPAGAALLEVARRTLATLSDGIDQTRRVAAGLAGQITITFLDMSFAERLPAILRRFRTAFPHVELRLQEGTTSEQVEALLGGSADVGFMRRPGIVVPNLEVELVMREPIRVALPRTHPLARRASVPLAALASTPLVMTPREKGPGFHDQVLGLCRLAGFSPIVVQQARQMQTVVGLVAAGFGAALVPDSVAAAKRRGVVFRPVRVDAPDDAVHLDLIMAWDGRRPSAVRDRFLDTVRRMKS
ncbi:LysR substrate-binding domain-containing protein [Reyranella sp. CPCC 100927]|uniref:LysR substrate-binding domain-containing protein n=1 Tax=Reyranella sp. CPCC 100927 TaxID=2599616 RepID=UPI0011B7C678|nr:LysR substrate-binding domain-containing protein [Reyranella sp. CPCC 100927]TWT05667.1 LysR family transcriptional regulator [Reyranella sp. CPCC 100927]